VLRICPQFQIEGFVSMYLLSGRPLATSLPVVCLVLKRVERGPLDVESTCSLQPKCSGEYDEYF